jgi:hypothetical protein
MEQEDLKKVVEVAAGYWVQRSRALGYDPETSQYKQEFFAGVISALLAVGVPESALKCMPCDEAPVSAERPSAKSNTPQVVDTIPPSLVHTVAKRIASFWPEHCGMKCDWYDHDTLKYRFYDGGHRWDVEARHVYRGFSTAVQLLHGSGTPLPGDLADECAWEEWLQRQDPDQFGFFASTAVMHAAAEAAEAEQRGG